MSLPKVAFKNIALVKRVIDHDGTGDLTNKDVQVELDPEALDAYISIHGIGQLVEAVGKFLAHVRQRNSEINPPPVAAEVAAEETHPINLDSAYSEAEDTTDND